MMADFIIVALLFLNAGLLVWILVLDTRNEQMRGYIDRQRDQEYRPGE